MGIDDVLNAGIVITKDPVEQHILKQLQKLQYQNKRLKGHLEKSGAWAHLKKISKWNPSDFFHYFCNRYHKKYRAEYKESGNVVRAYQRIESFMAGNALSNKVYKSFIDRAFDDYFNNVNRPRIANVCSPSLYKHLMGKRAKTAKPKDYLSLEQKLAREKKEFDTYMES